MCKICSIHHLWSRSNFPRCRRDSEPQAYHPTCREVGLPSLMWLLYPWCLLCRHHLQLPGCRLNQRSQSRRCWRRCLSMGYWHSESRYQWSASSHQLSDFGFWLEWRQRLPVCFIAVAILPRTRFSGAQDLLALHQERCAYLGDRFRSGNRLHNLHGCLKRGSHCLFLVCQLGKSNFLRMI